MTDTSTTATFIPRPRYRKQLDQAGTPLAARNALGICNWNFLDNGSGQIPLPPSDLTFKAGGGINLGISGQTITITNTGGGGGGGVASLNGLTGVLTIAAGAGISVNAAGTTITVGGRLFSSTAQGDVTASGGGTVNFLRADGTWATPAGGGGLSDAPSDGHYYARLNATWANLDAIDLNFR